MELLLRVDLRTGREPIRADVRVDIDGAHTIAALAAALVEHCGGSTTPPVPAVLRGSTGEVLSPDERVGAAGLCSGELLILGPVPHRSGRRVAPEAGITVDVLAGPSAPTSVILGPGRYPIGRDGAGILLDDPTVTGHHADLEIDTDWTTTITPATPEPNAVLVDGEPARGPVVVGPVAIVQLGASAIVLRPFRRGRADGVDRLGQLPFHRTPYRPSDLADEKLPALADVPTKPDPSRLAMLTAVLPVATGVTMFAFTGQVQFLALTLLMPLSVVGSWFDQRRHGGQRYQRSVERFRRRLARRRQDLGAALASERAKRVRAAPDVADLARRAELRTTDLWSRGRAAPDFLNLRVGVGDVTSRVTVAPESAGDEEHRDEAAAAVEGHDVLTGVPVCVPMQEIGVLAIRGDDTDATRLATSVIVQAACLHSPEDLVIAVAVAPERDMSPWLKWLPHARSATSPLAGEHLVADRAGADRLLGELIEVAERRGASTDRTIDRRWPWVLVVLDEALEPDPALVSHFLDCNPAGFSVVWITDSEAKIVRQAAAVAHVERATSGRRSTLWFADPARAIQQLEPERGDPEVADRVARALAPVRDASVGTATTAISRAVTLFDAFGVETVTPSMIQDQWLAAHGDSLAAPVGMGADGPFMLDLVAHGPHALVGGTSGAGKSELLQTVVAALAAHYPPTRCNFLFVDYKGGASSTVFRDLPHTVGYVTNLDAALSLRALASLRAELNRRMQLLEGRAKDLPEMLAKFPNEAPPALVIVVDEFATLVKEVEGFVDGIVDIAQRGRSLGIHLILATQRPSGSVNDNILANTNLRIGLRMLDSAESASVIGSPEAAEIPVPLKGRAFARLGPRELVAFQCAYSGAPIARVDEGAMRIVVSDFTAGPRAATRVDTGRAPTSDTDPRTQLDVLVAAVVDAAAALHLDAAARPWREPLGDNVTLDVVGADARARPAPARAGCSIAVGMIDDPDRQDQYPAVVDLEDGGGLLVFGAGGTGKTTLLRTIAAAASTDAGAGVVCCGIDFSSRALRALEVLPQCIGVATGDDLEATTRLLALLDGELRNRRKLFGARQAESMTSWIGGGGDPLPRVLLLVDGYANLANTFQRPEGGAGAGGYDWLELLHRLVIDGRQVGIHVIITAERRAAVPAMLMAGIANRIVLRQADEASYLDFGISARRMDGVDLPPGRGIMNGQLIQLACVVAGDGAAQAAALAERSRAPVGAAPAELLTSPLSEYVAPLDEPRPPGTAALGRADLTHAPVLVDCTYSNVLVAGPPRSGRSTALRTLAEQLAESYEVWAIGTEDAGLRVVEKATRTAFGSTSEIASLLEELEALQAYANAPTRVLVVDDLDRLDDAAVHAAFARVMRGRAVRFVASIETRNLTAYTSDPLLTVMRRARRLLILQPDSAMEVFNATGVRAPLRPGLALPPGRGVLIVDRVPVVVHVASVEASASGGEQE
ncbi:MAG: FtsK/SpoIIIE domain-containing protein [Actinomycetota bacterium]